MLSDELAIHGGVPAVKSPLTPYQTIGVDELHAAQRVLKTGVLSAFVASDGDGFLGGPEVQALEKETSYLFGSEYVISVNSWTSGLIAAIGSLGLEPGDEIIVTPWTMVATATAILHWNCIPVFCDIDPLTFNLDPYKVEDLITSKTRAILFADIFGLSADTTSLRRIAAKHNLYLVSDTAQSPSSTHNGAAAGVTVDIGGFSLNYHKHIHCGEGGLIFTNDSKLAHRMQLIRNHGEAIVSSSDPSVLSNILGYNFRLGEIEASIARCQLKKLPFLVKSRQEVAEYLRQGLSSLPYLSLPYVPLGSSHVYYVFGMILDIDKLPFSRDKLVQALRAEGIPVSQGYQCIHLNPIFTNRIAYGTNGFPWKGITDKESSITYGRGLCPIAEDYHFNRFLGLGLCLYEYTNDELDSIIFGFCKIWRFYGLL
jgi:perosamine synthetase